MKLIHNSELLNKLLEEAKNLSIGMQGALSAERFLIAVFDFVLEHEDDDADEAVAGLANAVREDVGEVSDFRNYLVSSVKKQDKILISDNLFIQNRLFELQHCKDESVSEVTPEMLVRCILRNPTKKIAAYMENSPGNGRDESVGWLKFVFEEEPGIEKPESNEAEKEERSNGSAHENSVLANLTERSRKTRNDLLSKVYGQNHAINVFVAGYFQAELQAITDKRRNRPRATFLFAGPPGVGKTFLAETVADSLELPYKRFDMSEYSDNESGNTFAGANSVYKNASAGTVTSFVAEHPKCVVLFDEIEKAHLNIIHLFLQILDGGMLRDNFTDKKVSFADAILIFTTNAGKQLYQQSETGDFSDVSRKVILNALEKDVHPESGVPYFPAAICSRFASGNVIMFNQMQAHHLRKIARKEVLLHKENFEKETGIRINIEESVYSALLFAEGGQSDARTIRSRSEAFFYSEMYELMRLLKTSEHENAFESVRSIDFSVDLSSAEQDVASLFEMAEKPKAVVVTNDSMGAQLAGMASSLQMLLCQDERSLDDAIRNNAVEIAIIDLSYGLRSQGQVFLNAEDRDSVARDLFWRLREQYPSVPIYILQNHGFVLNEEEKMSFLNCGARGFLDAGSSILFDGELMRICDELHQQKSIHELARANKVLAFETAQIPSEDQTSIEIRLFDFSLSTALDAEDANNVLSNISKPEIRFSEVIGAKDAKQELQYFVDYLKNPKKFIGSGLRAPRGVLLYGPPGTGKTMLAKAMAYESDVAFINAEGNQFLKKYVGEGNDRVHELFRIARKYAPSILFVDEIDAIAKERIGGENAFATGEDVLTTFLAEMDGFKNDPSKPVFVLAATNFDVEAGSSKSLDSALLRRFDRKIKIDLPTKTERIEYLHKKMGKSKVFEVSESSIENLAVRSTGSSLAELENVIEMALRDAVRAGKLKVDDDVLENAFETYNSGEVKQWDNELLERVARHEAGHTFLCWESGEKPSYVTIVSRADHGGYMQHGGSEGKYLYTKKELLAKIRTSLGGRAAEIVYYGEEDGVSTGASGDLVNATSIARRLVCQYGMDESQGLAVFTESEFSSDSTSAAVHDAVNRILRQEMNKAVELIKENREKVDKLVNELLRNNYLNEKEINAVLS